MSAGDLRLWAAATCLALLTIGLGFRASRERSAARAQASPRSESERGPLAAVLLTRTGYAPVLSALAAAAAALALSLHESPLPIVRLVILQLVSQGTVLLLKSVFRRARPLHWRFRREAGFSYPSGHATTAVVFYGGLLSLVLSSSHSAQFKLVAAALFLPWAAGMCWSRLALRAHHPSDVLGGALLGAVFLCVGAALPGGLAPAGQFLAVLSMSASQRSSALVSAASAASSSLCNAPTRAGSA